MLELLIPVAAFLAIGAAVWFVFDMFVFKKTRTEERLDRFRGNNSNLPTANAAEGIKDMIKKASPTLAKPLQPKTEKEAGKLKERLEFAGFRREEASMIYLGIKGMCLVIGLVLGGATMMLTAGLNMSGLLRLFMIAGTWFFIPDLVLWFLAKRRKDSIFLGLPDALDLLVVCVEAGLGLDQAMRKVADEMSDINPIIAYEFGICNMEVQMGQSRDEVFHQLGRRNGVDDLKTLASVIVQTDKFGSSVAKALRVMSDSMRTQRRQIAEEKAAKTAVKLIFPLVLFIFPGIFVVLVGPAAITMINEMLPAMQNR